MWIVIEEIGNYEYKQIYVVGCFEGESEADACVERRQANEDARHQPKLSRDHKYYTAYDVGTGQEVDVAIT